MIAFGRLNFVNVGPGGTFAGSGAFRTTPAHVDRIFAHLATLDPPRLVVHFHGGLVNEEAGMAVARSMAGVYRRAGSHPVTFVWETGAWETISNQLHTIHRTQLFRKLRDLVLRRAAKYLGQVATGKGGGRRLTQEEIDDALLAGGEFESVNVAGARGGGMEDVEQSELEAEFFEDLEAEEGLEEIFREEAEGTPLLDRKQLEDAGAKGFFSWAKAARALAVITIRVIKRHVQGRDHDFYPTVVEEVLRELYLADLGDWIWSGMKDKAAAMFAPNASLSGQAVHAGTYFLDKLAELRAARPDMVVDLVGHSAGSIAICNLLQAMAARGDDPVRRIGFLAPACTTQLMHDELVSRPERFSEFRMFTMSDAYETEDSLVPFVYTHSLLYFISGVLEGEADVTIAGLARHQTGADPYDDEHLLDLRDFVGASGRLVLSRTPETAPAGRRSHAEAHGDFDNDRPTRDSLTSWIAAPPHAAPSNTAPPASPPGPGVA